MGHAGHGSRDWWPCLTLATSRGSWVMVMWPIVSYDSYSTEQETETECDWAMRQSVLSEVVSQRSRTMATISIKVCRQLVFRNIVPVMLTRPTVSRPRPRPRPGNTRPRPEVFKAKAKAKARQYKAKAKAKASHFKG